MKQDSLFVAEALGLPIPPSTKGEKNPFTSVTSDSRKAGPGSLFVALKGENVDGHDFISTAITQGATGIICRKSFREIPDPNVRFFKVEDTLAAYRKLGATWRKRFQIPVVLVAGSVGKTTTKELLAALLHGKWKSVLKTQESQNGFVGIPMTLLELRPEHGAAVIEVGIDEVGAMEKHVPVVAPTASLLTAIGPEHLEKLHDVPTVAREEGLAFSMTAASGGTVVISLDDPWIRPLSVAIREGKKVCYTLQANALPPNTKGVDEKSLLRATLSRDGSSLEFAGMGLDGLELKLPLLGAHNAQNLLAAVAVARSLGLSTAELQLGLKTFKGAEGRSELRELAKSTPVICDYYNANPASVEAGLDLLTQVSRREGSAKTRWACLGDMLELGPEEESFHRGLARKLGELRVEHVLLYGNRMKALQSELESQSYPGKVSHFASQDELAAALTSGARPGDAILIKGSRSMKMEEVWKKLEAFIQSHWASGGA